MRLDWSFETRLHGNNERGKAREEDNIYSMKERAGNQRKDSVNAFCSKSVQIRKKAFPCLYLFTKEVSARRVFIQSWLPCTSSIDIAKTMRVDRNCILQIFWPSVQVI